MRHRPLPSEVRQHPSQPAAFNLAAAFGGTFLLVAASGVVGLSTNWAVALIALVVGLCSAGATWPASLGVAVIGWLFVTGFVINSLGELHITGLPDLWRLLVIVGVAVVSTAASRRRRHVTFHRGLIRPAGLSAATVLAQPARLEPVVGGTVPARVTGSARVTGTAG